MRPGVLLRGDGLRQGALVAHAAGGLLLQAAGLPPRRDGGGGYRAGGRQGRVPQYAVQRPVVTVWSLGYCCTEGAVDGPPASLGR